MTATTHVWSPPLESIEPRNTWKSKAITGSSPICNENSGSQNVDFSVSHRYLVHQRRVGIKIDVNMIQRGMRMMRSDYVVRAVR